LAAVQLQLFAFSRGSGIASNFFFILAASLRTRNVFPWMRLSKENYSPRSEVYSNFLLLVVAAASLQKKFF
jgi:hypothetical protein